ncbi:MULTISPECIES: hypothetical protein [unclassified Thiocapsa]|uniref:hypothetical protein n=1 Tax=unclassified Thiocapsa TaxID=2641286 RepID=UPI0035B1900F
MQLTTEQLGLLMRGMRSAFARGENAMSYARELLSKMGMDERENLLQATLIAYDLQSGAYVKAAKKDPESKRIWCTQIAGLIEPLLPQGGRVLEVGVGEATTLAGVLKILTDKCSEALGFDISWSRVSVANS